jgi:hypothetical protein
MAGRFPKRTKTTLGKPLALVMEQLYDLFLITGEHFGNLRT